MQQKLEKVLEDADLSQLVSFINTSSYTEQQHGRLQSSHA